MDHPQSKRPIWWSRHDIRPFTLNDEEAWQLITSPPWRCVIAWVTRENQPVIAPMAYQVLDGKIMLTTTKNRDKVKAFRRNPAISVCFQNAEGSKHVTVRGYVEFSEDPELVRRWITSFVESYGSSLSAEEKQLEIARYSSPDRLILIVHGGEDANLRSGEDDPGREGESGRVEFGCRVSMKDVSYGDGES